MTKTIVEPCLIRPSNKPWVNRMAFYEGYDSGTTGLVSPKPKPSPTYSSGFLILASLVERNHSTKPEVRARRN